MTSGQSQQNIHNASLYVHAVSLEGTLGTRSHVVSSRRGRRGAEKLIDGLETHFPLDHFCSNVIAITFML